MARQFDIETGADKAAAALERRQVAEKSHQWRELRNKLDSLLLATNVMKTDEVRRSCLQIDGMDSEQRRQYILEHWGPTYLEKSEPIIIQLEAIEASIDKDA